MEEDRVANQRSAFSPSFTLALYVSNEFGLRIWAKIASEKQIQHYSGPKFGPPRRVDARWTIKLGE